MLIKNKSCDFIIRFSITEFNYGQLIHIVTYNQAILNKKVIEHISHLFILKSGSFNIVIQMFLKA